MKELFKSERPVVPLRGVHLDLKGVPPTTGRLLELLKVFAAARYNVVLVEWEDTFPWTVDKRFRSPTAYTPSDVQAFIGAARDLGIELIPLVQCLGHMQTPLAVPGYEHLRELSDDPATLNSLADGAGELVTKMVDDVLALMPGIRRFHLGGDEAWGMGRHPLTKAFIEKHGKDALYMRHVEPILDHLNSRGVRPILWHDMMIEWSDSALKALAAKSDLLTWGYGGHPDSAPHHFNTKYIRRFHEHGFKLWGGTAYKGADGHNIDLPVIQRREENAMAWAEIAGRFDYAGVIATAWSRYSTGDMQCEPIDAALDSLVSLGVILHDGHPPEGGIAACVSALDELGERSRFEACKTAMEKLAAIRHRGWWTIQALREQQVICRSDQPRGDWHRRSRLKSLGDIIKSADEVAAEVKNTFAGLIEPIWIGEYLESRLAPLRDEFDSLK